MSVEEIVDVSLGEPFGILNFKNAADKQRAIDILIKNGYYVWDCTEVGPLAIKFSGYL